MLEPFLIVVLLLVLGAEFVNGWTDAPNAIATVVSTHVLTPGQAVIMASVLNILGAMSGTAVAATLGKGFVRSDLITLSTVAAAMIGIIVWSTFAWYLGLPTSESHALVAGLTGAALAVAGTQGVILEGWRKVFIGIGISTFLGLGIAFGLMVILYHLLARIQHGPGSVERFFGRLQLLSSAFMAFAHGSNDGQKFIGVFSLTLVLGGVFEEFHIPFWVILLCASVMGLGTAVGGWRIIKTMGLRLTKLTTVHGFAAETSAGIAIELASRLGIPLSTTHTITTSIMGAGATRRLSAVRWGVGANIVAAWILTFPVCGFIAWAVAKFFALFSY
jgi:inorganic phosphate transporter, PiT family